MTPAQLTEAADERLYDAAARTARNPWLAAAGLAAARLDLAADDVLEGLGAATFARVEPADRPDVFRLAEDRAAPVALLWPLTREGEVVDVLALDLTAGSGRRWRASRAVAGCGTLTPDTNGTLKLRQDAHAWVRAELRSAAGRVRARQAGQSAKARAYARVARETGVAGLAEAARLPGSAATSPVKAAWLAAFEAGDEAEAAWLRLHPAGALEGSLVLDAFALDWRRSGVLKGVEQIEILDAPAGGPLGRALARMNPRIGGPAGVPLWGAKPEEKRRAA